MKVIVMGCGRIGSQVSRRLATTGHDVTVIDNREPYAQDRLGPGFKGRLVHGLGFDRKVLEEAGIRKTDAFVSASQSDNANVVAARIARNFFHVPRVVCRMYDPRKAQIYERLGLETLAISTWGAGRIVELVTHSDLDVLYNFGRGEVSLVAVEAPHTLAGKQVRQLLIPGEIDVVAITRGGMARMPGPGTEIQEGDLLHVAAASTSMRRLAELIGLERRD
jgi:trk system potassium uptake protein TrkA